MRIVMVSPTLGDAFGQERVLLQSSELLENLGHEVFFIADKKHGPLWMDAKKVLWLDGLASLRAFSSRAKSRQYQDAFLKFCNQSQADIVHFLESFDARILRAARENFPTVFTAHTVAPTCPASTRFIYGNTMCGYSGGLACTLRMGRTQCLDHFSGPLHKLHAVLDFEARHRELVQFSAFFAISSYIRKLLLDHGFAKEKVCLITNPVHVKVPTRIPESGPPLFVCASRLSSIKGIEVFLRALARIRSHSWRGQILGSGNLEPALVKLTRDLDLQDRVEFMGKTSAEKTHELIQSARALVQTNLGPEGFGLSVAEAGLLGTCAISSRVPALDEIIVDGQTGLLFSPGDELGLARHLERVLAEPQLAQNLGLAAQKRIAEQFSPARHVWSTLKGYAGCLENPALGNLSFRDQLGYGVRQDLAKK